MLTAPDAGRLDQAISGLDFMVSVDPYLNETTRHADVILPVPPALESSHFDLAFTVLSVRNVAKYSPAVFEPSGPPEFDILVKLTGIAMGMGPEADPGALFQMSLVSRSSAPFPIRAHLSTVATPEKSSRRWGSGRGRSRHWI